MKKIFKIVRIAIVFQILILGILIGTSKVQDMTLEHGNMASFNKGWSMTFGDGTVKEIEKIPFYDSSKRDEVIVASNVVPKEFCGKTLSFLAADKMIQIFIEDRLIYSFGFEDQRKVGHTPGSIMVFADIPIDSAGKQIQIKMQSPYEDYATYMTNMQVADRDVSILNFLRSKIFDLFCCMIIFLSGIAILWVSYYRNKGIDFLSWKSIFVF